MRSEARKVKVDNDILEGAAKLSLMHYCYRWDDCNPKCKLFNLCQERFADAGEYGAFEDWGLIDLIRGMETIGGTVVVRSNGYETSISATEATERTTR